MKKLPPPSKSSSSFFCFSGSLSRKCFHFFSLSPPEPRLAASQRRSAQPNAVKEKNSERDFFEGPFVLSLSTHFLASVSSSFFIATVTQKCDIFFGLRCDRDLPSSPMPFRFSLLRTGFSQFLTKAVQRLRWCAAAEWSRAEKKIT